MKPIEIFFSYAHEDEPFKEAVRKQLVGFDHRGIIRKWHDRMIPPGTAWRGQIDYQLQNSDIVLLFISPHFLDSDFCYEHEMPQAMAQHEGGRTRVIPIIVTSCLWEQEPFAALQVLPTDARPMDTWSNRNKGALNVARGVMQAVTELSTAHSEP